MKPQKQAVGVNMLKSTIVASILVLAAQTATANFVPVPMGSDEYPSGPVHRSKATATKKKDAQKREIEVRVKAERDHAEGERGLVLKDLDGDAHAERNVIIRRIGPGGEGHGGEGGERDVIIKRAGPGGPGEEKEMRVRVLRDGEGPEGGKPKVHIFKHGEGMGEWHGEGQGGDAPRVFFFGEPGEGHKRTMEIEVEGGPHHGKGEVHEFRFEGKMHGRELPPKVREHIHELIQNHMRHMQGGPRGGRAGHDGGEGRHAPRHAGPRGQRGPRGQGGPGMPGMPGQPGMGMRRMGPGPQGMGGGPGMGGPGMGNFGPRGMGPGMAPGAGPQRRMAPDGPGGMGGQGGMNRRFFNQPVPGPQGGEPGAGAAPPAPPAPAAPAAPGAGGKGGVNREEMRRMMIERLEKRLEELKKSEGKPQGSLINPSEFV